MNQKIRWITRTAAMLALLIALQWATSFVPKPAGQFVTGSFVNAVLAVTVLTVGMSSGITVALLSPVFAYVLQIAPNAVVVPAIMAGNTVFVAALKLLSSRQLWRNVLAWLAAALAKFGVLFALVKGIVCGLAAPMLLESGVLKPPMLENLPGMFSWPQLVTALIGGGVALSVLPVLKKAIDKS